MIRSGPLVRFTVSTLLPARARLAAKTQALLIGALLAAAAIAWAISDKQMAGMSGGTDLGPIGFYVGVWVVMMAAMMFPSLWPMVVVFHTVRRRRRASGQTGLPGSTALFLGGYLLSWTIYGLVAYLVVRAGRVLHIDALSWRRGGPYLAGAVLVAAATYQLTPAKDVCLRKCRGPMSFFLGHWREGLGGALRLGVEHGAWCIGCCWALMAALFALGLMSIGWMALVAALIAAEKLLPWKALANRGIAIALVCLGIAVMIAPASVPGVAPAGTSVSPNAAMKTTMR